MHSGTCRQLPAAMAFIDECGVILIGEGNQVFGRRLIARYQLAAATRLLAFALNFRAGAPDMLALPQP